MQLPAPILDGVLSDSKKRDRKAQKFAQKVSSECIALRVRHLNRTVTRVYDQTLKAQRITISQFALLGAIQLQGPVQPRELGKKMRLEKSTLSRNIRLMVERNWVRIDESEDGRAQLLTLTPEGQEMFMATAPSWEAAQKKAIALVGPDAGTIVDHLLGEAHSH